MSPIRFTGVVIHWRGPAPFHFVAIPDEHVGELAYAARLVSYGWGMVPAEATIAGHAFTTALFPKDGGYLLPLKAAVRRSAGVEAGDTVTVELLVRAPDAKPCPRPPRPGSSPIR